MVQKGFQEKYLVSCTGRWTKRQDTKELSTRKQRGADDQLGGVQREFCRLQLTDLPHLETTKRCTQTHWVSGETHGNNSSTQWPRGNTAHQITVQGQIQGNLQNKRHTLTYSFSKI